MSALLGWPAPGQAPGLRARAAFLLLACWWSGHRRIRHREAVAAWVGRAQEGHQCVRCAVRAALEGHARGSVQ